MGRTVRGPVLFCSRRWRSNQPSLLYIVTLGICNFNYQYTVIYNVIYHYSRTFQSWINWDQGDLDSQIVWITEFSVLFTERPKRIIICTENKKYFLVFNIIIVFIKRIGTVVSLDMKVNSEYL